MGEAGARPPAGQWARVRATGRFLGELLDVLARVGEHPGVWLVLNGAAVLGAGVSLWAISVPGTYLEAWALSGLVLQAVGVAWLLLLAGRVRGWSGRRIRPLGIPRLLVVALLGLVVVAAELTDGPLWLRYRASRAAMDRVAAEVVRQPEQARSIRRIGWFPAAQVRALPGGGMRFAVPGAGILDDAVGFAYSPTGVPAAVGDGVDAEDGYYHVEGPWYVWRQSW